MANTAKTSTEKTEIEERERAKNIYTKSRITRDGAMILYLELILYLLTEASLCEVIYLY